MHNSYTKLFSARSQALAVNNNNYISLRFVDNGSKVGI